MPAPAFESVSTWSQPLPETTSPVRLELVDALAAGVAARSPARLRVAIDGFTASGKTTFGHELAAALRALERPTLRASLDDFKRPWAEARELGYDRLTGAGYYRNAYDFAAARELLLAPAGADGDGVVALCARDPLTAADRRGVTVTAPPDAVLVVDSVFAFRPEYDEFWDVRIWLDVDPGTALRRGIARDAGREGVEQATRLHRDRYGAAEAIYLAEVDPRSRADVIIDNTDFDHPAVVRPL